MPSRSCPIRVAAIAAALLGLASGCNAPGTVSNSYIDPSYVPLEFRGQGHLPVIVRGDPFHVSPDVATQATTDALQGTIFGGTTPFVPAPQGSPAAYRVVVDFTGSAATPDRLCDRRNPLPPAVAPGPAGGSVVRATGALCRGDRGITSANAFISVADGPGGTQFRSSMARLGSALFPPQNPQSPGGPQNFPVS